MQIYVNIVIQSISNKNSFDCSSLLRHRRCFFNWQTVALPVPPRTETPSPLALIGPGIYTFSEKEYNKRESRQISSESHEVNSVLGTVSGGDISGPLWTGSFVGLHRSAVVVRVRPALWGCSP